MLLRFSAFLIFWLFFLFETSIPGDIRNSKHNLAKWSSNVYKSENYSEICIFCHTPHESINRWPLWNRIYDYDSLQKTYSSKGVVSTTPIDEHTKLCYSCHQEVGTTVSLKTASLKRPSIYAGRQQPTFNFNKLPQTKMFFGEGGKDHPVGLNYVQFYNSGKFRLKPKAVVESKLGLDVFKDDQFVCTSCHSSAGVHGGTTGMLRATMKSSVLCDGCHDISP